MLRNKVEESILRNWQIKLAIFFSFFTPVGAVTGAYLNLQEKIALEKLQTSERINQLQLKVTEGYADKRQLENIDNRTRKMENDITEIKTLLKSRFR